MNILNIFRKQPKPKRQGTKCPKCGSVNIVKQIEWYPTNHVTQIKVWRSRRFNFTPDYDIHRCKECGFEFQTGDN
jgi:predicted RNA-binding Zn-ribbon protein involved in translation (DUF1610 family)